MSHFRLRKVCRCCSNWSPCRSTYANEDDRVTGFIAVFCEDWDWSFNSLKPHSRQRRYPKSEERITQFTAVFCDDWKDSEVEGAPSASFRTKNIKQLFNQQSRQSLSSSVDSNDVANDTEQYMTLPRRMCNWQSREHYSTTTSREKHPLGAQIRSPPGWLERHELKERQPSSASSRENLETIIPSAASVNDVWGMSSAPATRKESIRNLPSSALPGLNMAINMATLTKTERNLFIDLAPSGLKDPCALMELVTKGREGLMSELTPGCSPIWGEFVEENEPQWHQGMEYDIELNDEIMFKGEERLENFPETTFEILFEEFIDY